MTGQGPIVNGGARFENFRSVGNENPRRMLVSRKDGDRAEYKAQVVCVRRVTMWRDDRMAETRGHATRSVQQP